MNIDAILITLVLALRVLVDLDLVYVVLAVLGLSLLKLAQMLCLENTEHVLLSTVLAAILRDIVACPGCGRLAKTVRALYYAVLTMALLLVLRSVTLLATLILLCVVSTVTRYPRGSTGVCPQHLYSAILYTLIVCTFISTWDVNPYVLPLASLARVPPLLLLSLSPLILLKPQVLPYLAYVVLGSLHMADVKNLVRVDARALSGHIVEKLFVYSVKCRTRRRLVLACLGLSLPRRLCLRISVQDRHSAYVSAQKTLLAASLRLDVFTRVYRFHYVCLGNEVLELVVCELGRPVPGSEIPQDVFVLVGKLREYGLDYADLDIRNVVLVRRREGLVPRICDYGGLRFCSTQSPEVCSGQV